MANTKFPLILNGIKFQVNPLNIAVSKPLVQGELATQGGVRFQVWYEAPEVITITGMSAGESAFKELIFLKQNFEVSSTQKLSELFYKTKIYRGFIQEIGVSHGIDQHLRFPYQITFQLIHGERFNIHDLALQPSGLIEEATNFLEENINAPIARGGKALGQVFGKVI